VLGRGESELRHSTPFFCARVKTLGGSTMALADFLFPNDYRVANVYARVLALYWHRATEANILNYFRSQVGQSATILTHGANENVPASIRIRCEDHLWFFIAGTANNFQAMQLCSSYQVRPAERELSHGVNPFIWNCSTLMTPRIVGAMGPGINNIHFVGMSLGGAIGAVMAGRLNEASPGPQYDASSFGSPRFADRRFTPYLVNVPYVRWMNEGDPIVFLPPSSWERPDEIRALFGGGGVVPEPFVHFNLGYVLQRDGTVYRAIVPRLSTVPGTGTIIGWAVGILSDPVVEHQIATYEARLREQAGTLDDLVPEPAPMPAPADQQAVEVPPVAPRPHSTEQVLPNFPGPDRIGDGGWTPQETPVVNDQGQGLPIVLPGSKPYYYRKLNKKYYVMWAGFPLFSARGRRDAKRNANRLNYALAAYDRASYKDEADMEMSVYQEFN